MRTILGLIAAFLAAPVAADEVQFGQTYLTCFFAPEVVGQPVDIREVDGAVCNISVEKLTKSPTLLGIGTYKKEVVSLQQGSSVEIFRAVSRSETPLPAFEAEKCATMLSQTIGAGDDQLVRAAAVPNSNQIALFCRVEANH